MITRLEIENFKAIRERISVPLGPFTVLVGPNDSGKSTILQALAALDRSRFGRMDHAHEVFSDADGNRPPIFSVPLFELLPQHDRSRQLSIAIEATLPIASGRSELGLLRYELGFGYELARSAIRHETLSWRGMDWFHSPQGREVHVGRVGALLDTFDAWMGERSILSRYVGSSPARYFPLTEAVDEIASHTVKLEIARLTEPVGIDEPFAPNGFGLVNVVDSLLAGPRRAEISVVDAMLRRLAPHVKTVTTRRSPVDKTKKELCFLMSDGRTEVPASQVSDGVVLAAAFALLTTGPLPSRRLLVEEPENGIHPRMLAAIVETLRDAGAATNTQIVIATQSPILLNHVEPEEVLLVTRADNGNVMVTPMTDTTAFDERIKDFALGELWLNVGERNLTAG